MAIIGRGTWIDKLASEMVAREGDLGRDTSMMRVESGLGASGIPHVGSIGDAVRAYGVALALQDAGYGSELIAYSDDLDGLRKVPAGMPASLEDEIARPVSRIPDPDGCHGSFGEHMSAALLEGLDMLGVRYDHRRAGSSYGAGLFREQADRILSRAGEVGRIISETTGQTKYESVLPYFAICGGCGRIYTTVPLWYRGGRVRYACRDARVGGRDVPGCGHEGEADVSRDDGKLAWKAEFAARWAAFDVRFEAYGKDIMESVRSNDRISGQVLGHPHPYHVKYEMLLDEGGKKISKSAGNVITAQRWLEFGTPQSLLLLLYKRIGGAREVGFSDIPELVNEYAGLERSYFGGGGTGNGARDARSRGLYEYANLLSPPGAPSPHADYAVVAELCSIYREDRAERVAAKLAEYGMIQRGDDVGRLVEMAGRFADEFGGRGHAEVEVDDAGREALTDVAAALRGGAGDIQGMIYEAARANGMAPRDLFRLIYQVILGRPRGPKLGPFIEDMGTGRVASMIERHL
ncbi:MAG: lysine--tRNA ligase [Nitrosopumilus sp.]|nr:lysine--tRNA ligase [Nitrosopumilus sp.]MDA7942921.1 lysine--tRNA ligase [Nitrosopumilus sp.]MDA7998414.1 lysine--tRNA ligase [Nitrosopumilus sp.]